MPGNDEKGIVYYIDVPMIKKAREKALLEEKEALDQKLAQAQRDLDIVRMTEEALHRIQDVLGEMRKIAVEAAENPNADRAALNRRLSQLKKQIDAAVNAAEISGVNLLDGSIGNIDDIINAIKDALRDS